MSDSISLGAWIRRAAREPLVHFLLLGVAIVALYNRVVPAAPGRSIVVNDEALRGLRQEHLRRTGTLPTAEEERLLVDQYLDGEVLYREALALGLDRGDIIVRRRLIQKMEFLEENTDATPEPTDADLTAWIEAHPERYARGERVSLVQVFVSSDRDGTEVNRIADDLRSRLRAGADPATLGDPFLRGRELGLETEPQIAGVFGDSFARAVMSLPLDEWSQPLRSSFGLHLVRLTARQPGTRPPLTEVRAEARQDWLDAERVRARRRALDDLKRRYDMRIAGRIAPPATVASAP